MFVQSSQPASPGSPASTTSSVLTPRRKVQAMLAQFGSDSESDDPNKSIRKARTTTTMNAATQRANHGPGLAREEEHSEEEEQIQRPSRLMARLMGASQAPVPAQIGGVDHRSLQPQDGPSNNMVSTKDTDHEPEILSSSSDGDENVSLPKRRLFAKTERSHTLRRSPAGTVARSTSPLFFSSPAASRKSNTVSPAAQGAQQTIASPAFSDNGPRSKVFALVEKHRKERLAKEAAEIVRDAVVGNLDDLIVKKSNAGRQRGSSPADESEEGISSGSEGATRRIANQARPTRKASKKALEEMNRETQRMSRNMQLAHQAKTKTKITKESLLARFNFLPPVTTILDQTADDSGKNDNLNSSSEEDNQIEHTTPPTSPLQGSPLKSTMVHASLATDRLGKEEMHGGLSLQDTAYDTVEGAAERGRELLLQYDRTNRTVLSPEPEKNELPVTAPLSTFHGTERIQVRSTRFHFSRQINPIEESDSDSDIEIVTARGLKRKFAAFESVRTRKVQGEASHVALRSLARLMGSSERKQSMTAVEMENNLRRNARFQAMQERQQKIQELQAKGVVVQTAEEREKDQQEVEDLVERARQEAAEIQKREKELAKKDGTYVRDGLDDEDDDSEDEDFEEDLEDVEEEEDDGGGEEEEEASGQESEEEEVEQTVEDVAMNDAIIGEAKNAISSSMVNDDTPGMETPGPKPSSTRRKARVVSDDEDEEETLVCQDEKTPELPVLLTKTPQSILRSTKKMIPGLQMSDDLPMGLSQAFAATMADSQSQDIDVSQEAHDIVPTAPSYTPDLVHTSFLRRVNSVDMINDSLPATQIQTSHTEMSLPQSERIPESPARGLGIAMTQQTPSHTGFDLTQDGGYILSPFRGSRFAETPKQVPPGSSIPTVILHDEDGLESPAPQTRGRLRRGQAVREEDADGAEADTAFQVMEKAARRKGREDDFEKSKSNARGHVDEVAEESEDEYAGLGGASDDEGDDVENEDDRRMIDEDTQVGLGDEAKLAGLYADRERERDEKAVSKLLKDITTGALRRKRGVGDELDLSDEEDQVARRREAKRREFARMRRELLKDEAVGKIAEDSRKEAFLRSIEDREDAEDEIEIATESQEQSQGASQPPSQNTAEKQQPLSATTDARLNKLASVTRRPHTGGARKPATLAEIRESVSFLIDEPDSRATIIDLGLSDSEDEPEAYVDLGRHFREVEANENSLDDDAGDLGDFVVDDEDDNQNSVFKKPEVPHKDRASFSERRTARADVIDRLSLLRQSSSNTSTGSSGAGKMAFFSSKSLPGLANVPNLLRRATTNSSLGSMTGRESVSATGVMTNKTERGNAGDEKEFIRRGNTGRRNAVNYQTRTTLKEEKMSERAGIHKSGKAKQKTGKGGHGFLGGLFRGDNWE